MLENKTANNIVDRYHRIITGDQNQIEVGGNPNSVQEIIGTAADPFGSTDVFDEVLAGVKDNSLTCIFTTTSGTLFTSRLGYDHDVLIASVSAVASLDDTPNTLGAIGAYLIWVKNVDEINLMNAYSFQFYAEEDTGHITSGLVSNQLGNAALIGTKLTIIRHPLPEE